MRGQPVASKADRITGRRLISPIKADRATAVAFADTARLVEAAVMAHRNIADHLERAHYRIQIELCVRADMQAILDEVSAPEAANG